MTITTRSPARCPYGHQLGAGAVVVGWMPCECPAALAASCGHTTWTCLACREAGWTTRRYDPPHPRTSADLAAELAIIEHARDRAETAVRETIECGLPPAARAIARLDRLRRAAGEVEAVRHRLAAAELAARRPPVSKIQGHLRRRTGK